MPEYIEREEVMSAIDSEVELYPSEYYAISNKIDLIPAADVEEIRHGKWIMRGGIFRCSECDSKALTRDVGGTGGFSHEFEQVKSKHCPECGAKMDKKE